MSDTLKYRWRLDQNYLTAITAGNWWRLLWENRFAIDPIYWHRGLFITLTSLLNSLDSRGDSRRFGREVEDAKIEPPLIVLGFWRSGTTHLHNMLALDPQFGYPNTYQVVHPFSFLSTEATRAPRMAASLSNKRVQDEVSVSVDSPQEDEIALALACLRSPMLGFNFPRRYLHYARYVTFEDVPPVELEEWKRTVVWFLKKLTVKYRRPLVLKSPPHTARIRLLLEILPEARFVNIHREPYSVFLSNRHASEIAQWFTYLQEPANLALKDEAILAMGRGVFDAYFDQRHLVPPGRLVDVAFEDLEARPLDVIRGIYEALGIPGYEAFKPRLQAHVDTVKGYRKNRLREIGPEVRQRVADAWSRAFKEWDYPV